MKLEETLGFEKNFQKVVGKYPSVATEFEDLKKVLKSMYEKNEVDLYKSVIGLQRYGGVSVPKGVEVYKIRRFRCASIRGRTDKIRVIYFIVKFQDTLYFVLIYSHDDNPTQKQEQITKATIVRCLKELSLIK